MTDRDYWTEKLKECPRASSTPATRLSDVNAAAKKLMLAKAELKRLEAEATS
jgi:hypothetical protein